MGKSLKQALATAPAVREAVTLAQVEDRLLTIRDQAVLLDSDVAALYDVETREVNQAIKNNPEKFPEGYILQLGKDEWDSLRSQIVILKQDEPVKNFDQFNNENLKIKNFDLKISGWGQHPKYLPKAFTEKGLYMLATILKGRRAVETTIAIVETYSKIRELTRTVSKLTDVKEKSAQKSLMQRSGEIIADILGEGMKTTDSETTYELNLAVMKLKHTVRRKPE